MSLQSFPSPIYVHADSVDSHTLFDKNMVSELVLDWLSRVPRQHSIGYLGDSFTGQKTQPTVSKY